MNTTIRIGMMAAVLVLVATPLIAGSATACGFSEQIAYVGESEVGPVQTEAVDVGLHCTHPYVYYGDTVVYER